MLTNLDPRTKTAAVSNRDADFQIVQNILAGDLDAFEIIMRRYNQRLFRAARSILKNDVSAQDAVQDAYVQAYKHLPTFRGPDGFASWLTRIAINQALMLQRKQRPTEDLYSASGDETMPSTTASPERHTDSHSLHIFLERAIDQLPAEFRSVFMLRAVEQMNVAETAECLALKPATVKTRYHRARKLLQHNLLEHLSLAEVQDFNFLGPRCDRMVRVVRQQISKRFD